MEVTGRQYKNSIWLTLDARMYCWNPDVNTKTTSVDEFNDKVQIHFRIYEYDTSVYQFTGAGKAVYQFIGSDKEVHKFINSSPYWYHQERAVSQGHDFLIYSKSTVGDIKFGDYLGNYGTDSMTVINADKLISKIDEAHINIHSIKNYLRSKCRGIYSFDYGISIGDDDAYDIVYLHRVSSYYKIAPHFLGDASLTFFRNHNNHSYRIEIDEKNMRLFSNFLKFHEGLLTCKDKEIRSMFKQGYMYREEDKTVAVRNFFHEPLDEKDIRLIKHPKVESEIEKYRADSSKENFDRVFNAVVCAMKKYICDYPYKDFGLYDTKEEWENNDGKMLILYRWVGGILQYKSVPADSEGKELLMVFTGYDKLIASKRIIGDYTKEHWKISAILIYEIFDCVNRNNECDGMIMNVGDSGVVIEKKAVKEVWKDEFRYIIGKW